MIRIRLETGPRRVAEANAGTQGQGRELSLVYMWRIHMETGTRRVAEAIDSANLLWERDGSCMLVGASIIFTGVGVGGVLRGSSGV